MGIDINTAKFLISAYEDGVRFENSLTLGRLSLFVDEKNCKLLQKELDRVVPGHKASLISKGWAEPLIRALGATQFDSMDKSDFEGATVLHDMNLPIAQEHHQKFDLVCDGGTLEHIFNFPTAIQNAMEMVKVGGHLIIQTPTNNWSGHGFYQFSPELYYRVLSEENGFRVKRMVIFEWGANKWYEVADPAKVRSRVYVVNGCRTSLLILAERVKAVPINQSAPQQSDYALIKWNTSTTEEPLAPVAVSFKQRVKALLLPILQPFRALQRRSFSQKTDYFRQNQKFFTPVDR
jgi:SAM-dependent methyltransferase